MKNLLTGLILIICLLSIIAGKIHWNQKIEATTNHENQTTKTAAVEQQTEEKQTAALTRHLPEQLAEKIANADAENATIKIMAIGSKATAEGSGTWTSLLQKKLDQAYGKDRFHIDVENFGDDLSINIVQQDKYASAIDKQPDIVLLEPFLLNDNGKVAMANTLESIEIMINRFKQALDQVVVMLQPPNPIHNAVHYPGQVQALKEYAEDHGYIYLDHWSNWPDYKSNEILDYIDENNLPNAQGHQAWAEYIANYFTGEELE